jgi:hypothetical protein
LVASSVILADLALFIGGLLFGLAVKKALTAIILLAIAGFILAYAGLSVVFSSVSPATIFSHLFSVLVTYGARLGLLFTVLPFLFLVGLAIGLWKG